jgi:hypothetical protein
MRPPTKRGLMMDAVAVVSILAVVGTIVVVVVIGIRVGKLMKNTHSEDK